MDKKRFVSAIRRIDEVNSRDPHQETADGKSHPSEWLYSERLVNWVKKLSPSPSEALLIAARGQHIARWTKPRESYDMTRSGYLRWREDLKKFHAEQVSEILREVGYEPPFIERVTSLILKKNLTTDFEAQMLEDALTLCFFEFQFADLAERTEEAKMIGILQKAWKKISLEAQKIALELPLPERERALLEKALKPQS